MKKVVVLTIMLIIVFAGLITSLYFAYFYMTTCPDKECFTKAIIDCKRKSFTDDNDNSIIQYRIIGQREGVCKTNVKILQIKRGTADLAILENKEMICSTEIGVYTEPESNLRECHGELKEQIQEMIIQRMHSQIMENLGKISDEITRVI